MLVHRRKWCRSVQGPIWALCAWRLRPVVSSCSVCRSSSETPHGRNLFLPFHRGGQLRWRQGCSSVCMCVWVCVAIARFCVCRVWASKHEWFRVCKDCLHICPVQSQPCVCVCVWEREREREREWTLSPMKITNFEVVSTLPASLKKLLVQTSCVPSLAPVCIMYSVTLAWMIQWQIATW